MFPSLRGRSGFAVVFVLCRLHLIRGHGVTVFSDGGIAMLPFSPRLTAAMIVMPLLLSVLPAEEPGRTHAHRDAVRPSPFGNVLYLGQSVGKDKFELWQTQLWATPYGNWEHRQADTNSAGFHADTFGMMAGFQRRRNSRLSWGGAAGGSWIHANGDSGAGDKRIDAFKTMLNAAMDETDWQFQVAVGYGHNSQKIERNDFDGRFGGRNSGRQWGVRTEFQLKLGTGLFAMEPFAGLDCMTLSQRGYTEHVLSGSGQPQLFGKLSENSIATTLGLRYRWRQTGQLVVWRPELTAAWFHEFGSDRVFHSSQLDPFPTLFTFPDSRRPRDHLLVGVGIVGHLGSTMDVFARYAADIAGDDTAHAILLGTHWKF
ncbi:MAG: autotransporter outer membrane beta-barrel domain-containing protein [Planctomycetaceae bacterium]|nr:autotransporter outer membrane beta-barrel domain-containing protein [Planctomycetaceae bacterium]